MQQTLIENNRVANGILDMLDVTYSITALRNQLKTHLLDIKIKNDHDSYSFFHYTLLKNKFNYQDYEQRSAENQSSASGIVEMSIDPIDSNLISL